MGHDNIPKIWIGSSTRTLKATSGQCSGGLASPHWTQYSFQNKGVRPVAHVRSAEYFAGVVLGEKRYVRVPSSLGGTALVGFEQWFPDEYSPEFMRAFPCASGNKQPGRITMLVPQSSGDAVKSTWQVGNADPFAPGIGLAVRASWDPRCRLYAVGPNFGLPPGYNDQNPIGIAVTTRDIYTWDQFPYGGTPRRIPRVDAQGQSTAEAWRTGTRACWIIGLNDHPLQTDETFYGLHDGPGVYYDAMAWWMPDDGVHYRILFYNNWNADVAPNVKGSAAWFMGCPAFFDVERSKVLNQNPIVADIPYKERLVGYYYNNIPSSWNPSFPNADLTTEIPSRSMIPPSVDPMETLIDGAAVAEGGRAPHIKLDSQFMLPYIEFPRPAWMDSVPTGTVIDEATAEVKVTGLKRMEYQLELWRWPMLVGVPNYVMDPNAIEQGLPGWTRNFYAGYTGPTPAKFGWILKQLSGFASPQNEDEKTWVTIHKVMETVGPSGTTVDSDNTHLLYRQYENQVYAATGVWPTCTQVQGKERKPPLYIPRQQPWYTSGAHGPSTPNPLTHVKMGHTLVGLQKWGHMTGATEDDLRVYRTMKEMERILLWHPNGQSYSGFEPNGTNYNYTIEDVINHGGDGYLSWLLSKNAGIIPNLLNYRYRYLAASKPLYDEPNDQVNTFPADAWSRINLKECFQGMLADRATADDTHYNQPHTRRHQLYRIMPCLPHWTGTGYLPGTNLSELYWMMAPNTIQFPSDTNTLLEHFHKFVFSEITYQHFSTWQIRNIMAYATLPSGKKLRIRIRTEWDS